MSLQVWFWILYVLALVGNFYFGYTLTPQGQPFTYRQWGGGLLVFILFGILGYATFGSPIK